MRIQKFIVENFQGLAGVHTFNMSERLTINVGKNGCGKTSFVNALRYVLTGVEPAGEIITRGAKRTTVTVILPTGIAFTREKSLEKGNRVYINKKTTTVTAFTETLSEYVPVASLKVLSSSEKLAQMKPQEIEAFLLSYAQDINKEEIMSMLPENIDDAGCGIVRELLPEIVSIDNISSLSKQCVSQRKGLKKSLTDLNAELKVLSQNLHAPQNTKEELDKRLQEAEEKFKLATIYESELKAYNEAQQRCAKHDEMIKDIEQALLALNLQPYKPEDRVPINEAYQKARESRDQAVQNAATYKAATDTLRKLLDTLDQPVCPLSDKLKCTTDKTEIRKDVKESLAASEKAEVSAKRWITRYENKMAKCLEELKQLDAIKEAHERKKILDKQKEQLLLHAPKPVEKPKPIDVQLARENVIVARRESDNYEKFEKYKQVKTEFLQKKQLYIVYDSLCEAFGDKGIVKEKITERFIHKFVAMCNDKAHSLRVDMKIQWKLENGVVLLTDFANKGCFLTFESLSGGEKAQYLFVLMSVLCELSGFNILMLDELSVLDKEGFKQIMKMARQHLDSFDHIILCAVDHEDILEVIGRKGAAA